MIPGERCAVLLHYPGNTNNPEPAALYHYRDRPLASGEDAREFSLYRQRKLAFVSGMSAHEVIVELLLPLK